MLWTLSEHLDLAYCLPIIVLIHFFERATIAFSVTLYDCLLPFFENDSDEQKTASIDISRGAPSHPVLSVLCCEHCQAISIFRIVR